MSSTLKEEVTNSTLKEEVTDSTLKEEVTNSTLKEQVMDGRFIEKVSLEVVAEIMSHLSMVDSNKLLISCKQYYESSVLKYTYNRLMLVNCEDLDKLQQ